MDTQNEKTKKVVVVIVEGTTDKDAFQGYLNRIGNKKVFFSVCHCDINSSYDYDEMISNDIIEDIVKQNAVQEHYCIDDIALIVQLTDTDGVFCNDNVVEFDSSLKSNDKPIYSNEKIKVKDVRKFLEGKAYKKQRLNDCINLNEIEFKLTQKIKYEIYYMSCNLESALYNIYTNDFEYKEDLAQDFALKFAEGEEHKFIEFMNSINASKTLDFNESWKYIKTGNNSLKSCSNFIIFLYKLMEK